MVTRSAAVVLTVGVTLSVTAGCVTSPARSTKRAQPGSPAAVPQVSVPQVSVARSTAPSLAELGEALDSSQRGQRWSAAIALGKDGAEPRRVPAVLVEMTEAKEARVRQAAVDTLAKYPGTEALAVPALVGALADDAAVVRRAAASSLGVLARADAAPATLDGELAAEAVPALVKALEDDSVIVRRAAAGALGGFGPSAKEAIGPLWDLVTDRDRQTRESAQRAIDEIQQLGQRGLRGAGGSRS